MWPSNEVFLQIGGVLWSVLVAIELAVRYFMIGIVPGNRRPTTAMAWLLAIFFLPVVGLVAYWLFANPRLSRSRLEKQRRAHDEIMKATSHMQLPEEFHSQE